MLQKSHPDLSGVAKTLRITLYTRAVESQRPDAVLKDDKAVAIVKQMDYAFSPSLRSQPAAFITSSELKCEQAAG